MPYQFTYNIDNTHHVFRCDIPTVRCQASRVGGNRARCNRMCAIGTPFCYSHLLSEKHLRIKSSGLPNGGKGLFAQVSRNPADNSVVFRNGETIIDYTGESIDVATLNARYDLDPNHQFTAPYAFETERDTSYIDAACERGVGSLVNHRPMSTANAKFVKTTRNGITTVRLVAKGNIRNNREIFASYGRTYRLRNTGTSHRTTRRKR